MIPIEKVQDIIAKHDNLEKELSSGSIDTKLFAKNIESAYVKIYERYLQNLPVSNIEIE